MVFAHLDDAERYESLHPLFHQLFEYVKTHDLSAAEPGRSTLDGERLFINIAHPELRSAENQKLEVHRRYIDVHFPLTGDEVCGISRLADVGVASDAPFDESGDFALYSEPAQNYFTARPGTFYIVWPEDAHAPIIGEGKIVKAIAKVLMEEP